MPHSPETKSDNNPVSQHPRWKLVERVTSSTALKNSPRLQQLFRYLCERALEEPSGFVSEQQVGADVFGREPGYKSGEDTIVRTQISQLRKRLLQYFLSEGRDEPVTIEIPVGSYLPVFSSRKEAVTPEGRAIDQAVPHSEPAGPRRLIPALWAVVAVLTLLCGWLVWQNTRLRAEHAVSGSRSPYLDHLWKQLVDSGHPTYIVTSDANAMFFSDFMDQSITLDQYRAQSYPDDLLNKWITEPEARRIMGHFMSTYFTGSQDTFAVARITTMGEQHGFPTNVIYARDFRWQTQTDNVILLGHQKANPWAQRFDSQLNFTYEWHLDTRKGLLRNRKPQAGESESYQWNIPPNSTYATLSYVPTPEGRVLILGGSDMTAVDAGSRFLCDEDAVHKLHTALAIDLTQPVPHFEALIAARRARNLAYEPQLISVRVLK